MSTNVSNFGDKQTAHPPTGNSLNIIPKPRRSWDYNYCKLSSVQQQQIHYTQMSEINCSNSIPAQQQKLPEEIRSSSIPQEPPTQKPQQHPSNSYLMLTKLKDCLSQHPKGKGSQVSSSDHDFSANPVNRPMDRLRNEISGNKILSTTASHVSAFRRPLPRPPKKQNLHQGILSGTFQSQISHWMLNSPIYSSHLMNTAEKYRSADIHKMGTSHLNSHRVGGPAMIETEAVTLKSSDISSPVVIPQLKKLEELCNKIPHNEQNQQESHRLKTLLTQKQESHWRFVNVNKSLNNPNFAMHYQSTGSPFVSHGVPHTSLWRKRATDRKSRRERARRLTLNAGYDILHSLHPQLEKTTYVFKPDIIHNSCELIKKTKLEVSHLTEDIEAKRKEVNALNSDIKNFQSLLSASGAPISCEIDNKMEEIYFQWVRYRTTVNWKFWIFSIVIRALFDSYNASVSTANLNEMEETMLNWINKSFETEELNSKVLGSLQHLSSTTTVFTNPSNLQQEAYKAVDWTPPDNSKAELQE